MNQRMTLLAFVAALVCQLTPLTPLAADTDLDGFMQRVLARRDENWKKLQQYILDEDERFSMTGPDGGRLYGFERNYVWFIRDGFFIRSPLKVNGVGIDEAERVRAEDQWIRREKTREQRVQQRAGETQATVTDA